MRLHRTKSQARRPKKSSEMNPETCDRCGPAVAATVPIIFPVPGELALLTFCDHHAARYLPIIPGAHVCEIARPSGDILDEVAATEVAI